tara:strand:+ start:131 stop:334 length:204 start_codon:yes stop_codon:yes gene_type:complete
MVFADVTLVVAAWQNFLLASTLISLTLEGIRREQIQIVVSIATSIILSPFSKNRLVASCLGPEISNH